MSYIDNRHHLKVKHECTTKGLIENRRNLLLQKGMITVSPICNFVGWRFSAEASDEPSNLRNLSAPNEHAKMSDG